MRITTSPWTKLWQAWRYPRSHSSSLKRPDRVVSSSPRFQQDLAFAANALAAAGGIDVDPGQERGPQQILPVRNLYRDLVGLEGDVVTQKRSCLEMRYCDPGRTKTPPWGVGALTFGILSQGRDKKKC
jgi:hypothetical protein